MSLISTVLNLDETGKIEPFNLVLSRPDHRHFGALWGVTDLECSLNLNDRNEISFTYYYQPDADLYGKSQAEIDAIHNNYDELEAFRYVYVPELKEYFVLTDVKVTEERTKYKSCSGVDASAYELGQSLLAQLEINTDDDIARTDYTAPTVFYDPINPERSLLHRVINRIPQWSIKAVDTNLRKIQRTFSVDDSTVYDFLTGQVAKEFGCLFVFDSVERTISAYDVKSYCKSCRHRGEFQFKCPECGSADITYFGDDTNIYIDAENLSENLEFTTNTDAVKNVFRVETGDDNMDAAVQNSIPNGSRYIMHFSDDQLEEMPETLRNKIKSYETLYKSKQPQYIEIGKKIYDLFDEILYYQDGMAPTPTYTDTTAATEARKLTSGKIGRISVASITSRTTASQISNYVQNYAKCFIHSGKFKVTVDEKNSTPTWTCDNRDYNANGHTYKEGTWRGRLFIEKWGTKPDDDDYDSAYTSDLSLTVNNREDDFLAQKLAISLKNDNKDEGDITNVLAYQTVSNYKAGITKYNLTRLKSFRDSIQSCLDILIKSDQARPEAELYNSHYLKYIEKLEATDAEIRKREASISACNDKLDVQLKARNKIQTDLNFESYLGEELFKTFCVYKKEQTWSNSNYISNDLTNAEMFDRAKEAIQEATDELFKASEYQHSLTASVINLLSIPEFAPFKQGFKLSNFLRVRMDEKLYRLRLVSIGIAWSDIQHITVEFSDIYNVSNGLSDLQDLLNRSQQMATSYDGVKSQMKKTQDVSRKVDTFIEDGLDATLSKIVNDRDNQEIVYDQHGLLAREYDTATESYLPEQLKLLNNSICFTTDNWKTASTAIGKFIVPNPMNDYKLETHYGVIADTLASNLILSKNIGIYNSTGNMTFTEAGFQMVFDMDSPEKQFQKGLSFRRKENGTETDILTIDPYGNLNLKLNSSSLSFNDKNGMTLKMWDDNNANRFHNIEVDLDGTHESISSINGDILQINKNATELKIALENAEKDLRSELSMTNEELRTKYEKLTEEDGLIRSEIKQSAEKIELSVSALKAGGKNMLSGTKDFKNGPIISGDWTIYKDYYTESDDAKVDLAYFTTNSTDATGYITWKNIIFEPDTDYVLSFRADVPSSSAGFRVSMKRNYYSSGTNLIDKIECPITSGNIEIDQDTMSVKLSGISKDKRQIIKFKTRKNIGRLTDGVIEFKAYVESYTTIRLGAVQLEKGNVPTEWGISSDDTAAKLTILQDNINLCVPGGEILSCINMSKEEVEISGDKIKLTTKNFDVISENITLKGEQIDLTSADFSVAATNIANIVASKVRIKGAELSWKSDNSSMTSDGLLTCRNANISGSIACGNYGSGYWMKMNDSYGRLEGGYGYKTYGYIDYNAESYLESNSGSYLYDMHGIQIQATDVVRISSPHIAVSTSSNIYNTAKCGYTGTVGCNFLETVYYTDNGLELAREFGHYYLTFRNGIMVGYDVS